uniref:Secreted protein n=1 Tax=Sinocyclocheilus anshuiensis TaxID=1608454 RepID=A0A671LTV1_9TELE
MWHHRFWWAFKAWITSPRASSERLIFWASFSLSPSAPDFHTLSEPAKSTRFSLPVKERVSAPKNETRNFCSSIENCKRKLQGFSNEVFSCMSSKYS